MRAARVTPWQWSRSARPLALRGCPGVWPGEQPVAVMAGGVGEVCGDETPDGVGDLEVVVTERDAGRAVAGGDGGGGEPAQAGDGLGIEGDEEPGDSVGEGDGVVVEEPADELDALGVGHAGGVAAW